MYCSSLIRAFISSYKEGLGNCLLRLDEIWLVIFVSLWGWMSLNTGRQFFCDICVEICCPKARKSRYGTEIEFLCECSSAFVAEWVGKVQQTQTELAHMATSSKKKAWQVFSARCLLKSGCTPTRKLDHRCFSLVFSCNLCDSSQRCF
jgi:hypothetical protein